MGRLTLLLACSAAIALGLPACGSDEPRSAAPSDAAARKALAGAPAQLAGLHAQSNELLDGGPKAFEQRLARLKGHPVVVNKWASWCDPCRRELPHFQRLALKHGKRIAFLGVDSNDNDGDAREFLEEFPVSYPSYKDPDLKVSAVFNGVAAFPTTAFYDSKGELAYVKQGVYLEEKDLVEDIERYAR
jgi:cytochrome c biogenesis protein CcmG/thiol:disulfide interchange protein DsbE